MDIKSGSSTLIQAQNVGKNKPTKNAVSEQISKNRTADLEARNAALNGKMQATKAGSVLKKPQPKTEKSSSQQELQAALDRARQKDVSLFSREAPGVGKGGSKPAFKKLGQILDIRV